MNTIRHTRIEHQPREMMQKASLRDTFFGLKGLQETRPTSSVTTEFMESDFDEDDILSEFEEAENSPRISVNSSGQPSITTLSSYDEVQTPRSSRAPTAFRLEVDPAKPVEGPRGPHLFRSSMLSANSQEYQNALSLSPMTPKVAAKLPQTEYQLPITLDLTALPKRRQSGPFRFTDVELITSTLANWTPEMVAQWMLNAGIELPIAEKFVENDITGGILITLKFEDLKELGIPSFGVRTQVWDEIHVMRDMQPAEPRPETPIEDVPDRKVRRELRRMNSQDKPLKRRGSSRRKKAKADDTIHPLESVSIVGIEQVIPKPHKCSKGENCDKYKKRQRLIEAFKRENPFVDMEKGGTVMLAGNPGNPETAQSIKVNEDMFRPVSDAIPSVVASSDVMGPGAMGPFQYLEEAMLANVQARDPQDNVRQFLDFQHQHVGSNSSEVPPTPPFEIFPAQKAPHEGLRALPKLSIPNQPQQNTPAQPSSANPCSAVPISAVPYNPYPQSAIESSPDQTPTGLYRFASPFSDMDVPLTAVPLGPVARDFSQSVPPDMSYRSNTNPPPARTQSRASRRPSFPLMPSLDENMATPIAPRPALSPRSASAKLPSTTRPLQPPPRWQYPWTPTSRTTFEKAIAPLPTSSSSSSSAATTPGSGLSAATDVSYEGPMRKRRTKLLRHEWNEHYFTLRGTRLAMHKDVRARERTLEYVDIDDYAIACSSLASGSKLNAAFKAMSLRRGDNERKADVAAFAFQLIPQDGRGGVKLRKRESVAASAGSGNPAGEGVDGTGKTHHFAVKNRDERIDWMRELMLAKAMKQKGAGFEVSVNGNMI